MRCSAIIEFGDDYGDSKTTFHCQLEEGHSCPYLEIGDSASDIAYKLEWDGDGAFPEKRKIDESGVDLALGNDIYADPTTMELAIRKTMEK